MKVFGAFTPRNVTPVSFAATRTPFDFSGRRYRTSSRTEQMQSMGAMSTIFAIVTKLATGTASAEWCLYRTAASGLKEDRVKVTRHAALDVWNKPNPFMTQQEFVEVFEQHLDLTGETEWMVSTHPLMPGVPMELWPIRPDRIKPIPHPENYLDSWEYTDPDGKKISIPIEEIISIRSPNPTDQWRGMGPVQTVLADIEGDAFAAEYNRNFFGNSAEPGGVIEVPEGLDDDDFNRLRDQWGDNHRGVRNAHRVGILENGAKWVGNSYTQKDMQFTDLRSFSSEKVREAFGFPKPLLGSVDDVNRANAEAGEYVMAKWLLVPRLDRIKGALNNDFLPRFGATAKGLEFDYENVVPDDELAEQTILSQKVASVVALVGSGFDPDGVLDMFGLPRIALAAPAAPIVAPPEGVPA